MKAVAERSAPVAETPTAPGRPAERPLTILMVAGEASGDAHGAELIYALKEQRPGVRIIGVGGPKMAAAGQEQAFDLAAHAVVGLTNVLRNYFKFRRFFHRVLALARREFPDAVVLVDYPGFNLRLAGRLRRDLPGARTIFYISPQVWAWKPHRADAMLRTVDLLLTILPFEKAWFAQRAPKLNVQWVGHPMLDRIRMEGSAEPQPDHIALLPGSRDAEIETHLPLLWETARIMARTRPGLTFVLLSPSEQVQASSLERIARLAAPNFTFEYNVGYTVSHLSRCALALVASGTASLECAVVGVPQIVVYRVDPLTFAIGRRVVNLKHLSIVNVMAGEGIVPEFIQDDLQPERVAREALELLAQPARRVQMKERVRQVVATLGGPGASRRAAQAILLEAALAKVK
jgi:lipid-A-disaccharide synthase